MDFFYDPTTWIGFLTLIILEVILGVDNLIFIALLIRKLSPKNREKAKSIGLSLALIIRLGLLATISWLVTLTQPLFMFFAFCFSVRNIILFFGGIFLLFKVTTELLDRLKKDKKNEENLNDNKFWSIVFQIIAIDVVFSLDAILTAVGIVHDLSIMILSVIIGTIFMLFSSRRVVYFINKNQNLVTICLVFLLMIGFKLIAESFGFHISNWYLYFSVLFSIFNEYLNSVLNKRNLREFHTTLKKCTKKKRRDRRLER